MESHYTETHQTWNKIAQLYEDTFMDLDLYNETYRVFCELLPNENTTILEIGCGPGNITRHLLNLNPQLKILATDISENMIHLAKKNHPSIDIRMLDCRNISEVSHKFAGIVCGFTIPYLAKADLLTFIADSAKLLHSNGIFYISFVEGDYEDSGFIAGSSGDRTYFYYYDYQMIKQTLVSNRLAIVHSSKKEYQKADGSIEIHTVIQARKQYSPNN